MKQTRTIKVQGDSVVMDVYEPPIPTGQPPLLLIHGWGGSGRYWKEFCTRLETCAPLIVPDLPGVGRSLPVTRTRDMQAQVAVLETLLHELGIERVHLVGHSMGGALAMLLAARRPERVERVVLTSISLFRNDSERRFFQALMKVWAVGMRFRAPWLARFPTLARQSAQRYFYCLPDDNALLQAGFEDYLQMDYGTAMACARAAGDDAIVAAAAQMTQPTLLVVGRHDPDTPQANVAHTQGVIQNLQVHWMEQSAHLPMVEEPDEYAQIVRAFLNLHQTVVA